MDRQTWLLLIMGLAILNGLFSPFLLPIYFNAPAWFPDFLPRTQALLLYATSLVCSTITVMLAGVPAAIYERVTAAKESTDVSLGIWFAGTLLLTLPSLFTLLGAN